MSHPSLRVLLRVCVFVCIRNISYVVDANKGTERNFSLFFRSAIASSLSEAVRHACGWLAFVFSARCVFLGVCLCTLGCQPSIILAPSGLCVGLFHQHHHLLVFYSRPQGYNDCTTFQICSSSPSDWLPYPKSGSYFLSVLYSLAALQLKMVRT